MFFVIHKIYCALRIQLVMNIFDRPIYETPYRSIPAFALPFWGIFPGCLAMAEPATLRFQHVLKSLLQTDSMDSS